MTTNVKYVDVPIYIAHEDGASADTSLSESGIIDNTVDKAVSKAT